MNLPTYTIGTSQFDYEPRAGLSSLCWYNIANCARQRMQLAHHTSTNEGEESWFERWKRERVTFWTLTRKSIPSTFE